jgi:hypothetical protein
LNIRASDIHNTADLVVGRPAYDVDDQPRIRDVDVSGAALAIASAQNVAFENPFMEVGRPVHVG